MWDGACAATIAYGVEDRALNYSALHRCNMPPWCRAIRGSRQRRVPTRRSNVLSLRLGQTTTQDGVLGLALRPDQPIYLPTSTDLGRTAGEDRLNLSSRLCSTHTLQHTRTPSPATANPNAYSSHQKGCAHNVLQRFVLSQVHQTYCTARCVVLSH